jgi:hypothetical protein
MLAQKNPAAASIDATAPHASKKERDSSRETS